MFSSFTNTDDALITNRLGRIQAALLALQLSTKEDYLANLTSMVNEVINEDYQMQTPITIAPQTPAVVGSIITNLTQINNDYGDIADEMSRLENNASVLYNLAASVQNALRQQIREGIYASTNSQYNEAFINENQISSTTATLDFVAGRAMSTLIQETILTPTIAVGGSSVGSTVDDVTSLVTGVGTNLFTWNGTTLELVLSFSTPTIVNRIILQSDDYKGYTISTLTTSPDGSLFTDVLLDLGITSFDMGAQAGKYSGATVIDFSPRSVATVLIILENNVDFTTIPLRTLTLSQRSYQPNSVLTSDPQTSPIGSCLFSSEEVDFSPYTSITHQISSNGLVFTTIVPGVVVLPSTWWYRALFSRSSTAFNSGSQALAPSTADPGYSTGYTLASSQTTVISQNTIERVLVFTDVTGVIPLRETPLPGTLLILNGSTPLTPTQFSLSGSNVLSLGTTYSEITVSYQTSAAGATNITALQQYYSSFLDQVQFTAG